MSRSLLCAALILGMALSVAAQPSTAPPSADASGAADAPTPLSVRQQRVQRLVRDFEEKLRRLAASLEQSEPRQAARLRQALEQSQQVALEDRVATIVQLLAGDRLTQARDAQGNVLNDMARLLDLLTREDDRLSEMEKEIRQLQAWRESVQKLIKDETGHRRETDRANDPERAAEDLEARAQAIRDLIQKQEALQNQTRSAGERGPSRLAQLATPQGELRKETQKLTGREPAESPPTESSPSPQSPTSPSPSQPSPSSPSPSSPSPSPSIPSPSPSSPSPSPSSPSPSPSSPSPSSPSPSSPSPSGPSSAQPPTPPQAPPTPDQESLSRAAEHQQQAESQLAQGKSAAAVNEQAKAIEELRRALEQVEREKKRIQSLPPDHGERMAKAQDSTAGEADALSKEMEKAAQQSSPPSDSPSPSGQQSPPKPGQQSLQKAQQSMKQASDSLRKPQLPQASKEQQKAIEQLQQAQKEIEDRLAQLRQEMQDELLAALEARFRQMLARQQAVTAATVDLQAARPSPNAPWPDRKQAVACAQAALEQNSLAQAAQEALDLILEEASTVVFPRIVEQLRDDMLAAHQGLARQDTGPYIQALHQQIEDTLRQLIEALEKAQKQREEQQQQQQPQQQQQQQQQQPLVPESAELKLLRSAQISVNRLTTSFDSTPPSTDAAAEVRRIARRQADVTTMAEDMLSKP